MPVFPYGSYGSNYIDIDDDDDSDVNIIIPHIDMSNLNSGDTISCRIKESVIVGPYESYDDTKSFIIVSKDEYGYYLFVPIYINLKDSVIADQYRCRKLQIDKKYLNENIVYVLHKNICSIDKRDEGLNCKSCNEFTRFAASNQCDGSFMCYNCRSNPYR